MAFLHTSAKVMIQIIHFSNIADEERIAWNLTLKDSLDIYDIAKKIYSESKGTTCSEKVFIMVESLKDAFETEAREIWNVLSEAVGWNPWIEQLKEIYMNEFIRQDRIFLDTKYERMNKRMKRKQNNNKGQ